MIKAIMDRLGAMQTYLRVVESGSFSSVARQLGTTQSYVSKQILALEKHLNAKLLSRTTRSISLTDEGRAYYETAQRIVAEVDEAEERLRRGAAHIGGRLRIGASAGFGRFVLFPIVREFMHTHPDIEIDLQLNDGFVDLVAEGLDAAIRVGDLGDSSLLAARLGTAQRSVLATQTLAAALNREGRLPANPEALAEHNCVIYTGLSTPNLWLFDAPESKVVGAKVRVRGRFATSSTELVREAVLSGLGIGFAPNWFFTPELASGEVVRLLPKYSPHPLPIHAIYPSSRKHSQRLAAFIALAKMRIGALT
jgi:DNA-binding transcriptional LysR family regulator